ncbi:heme utilization protein [Lysinibacter sp. HNR]|uniref:heme utilization protein n=1 Tax=Lysinibacter sp. HNR TaxID=3031408 RepID=UPI002435BC81|nr:heme utilization protein [Lysinibacter sp. HNR]WGD37676.1 heme utilization protein [Lysinibacter sp. HNR]
MNPHVYGVFLLPDPITASAVSTITFQVKQQFGLVSAAAFPPHATLAGSVAIPQDPEAVIAALNPVLSGRRQFTVINGGIQRYATAITYDIDKNSDGTQNHNLLKLAVQVNEVLTPLAVPIEATLVQPFDKDSFRAHLSLASHELVFRPDLSSEVEEFIRALPIVPPSEFDARIVALYRFTAPDWSGHWWENLSWEHLRSWKLVPSNTLHPS